MCKLLCDLIAFLVALQLKCENLLGEKKPKFTETSTPQSELKGFRKDAKLKLFPNIVRILNFLVDTHQKLDNPNLLAELEHFCLRPDDTVLNETNKSTIDKFPLTLSFPKSLVY